ncbi:hypothetical protein HMPREF0204_11819 [Chryseobacterium gleum ATCC 35910]|uniref:Uncharacterized protein n=1 Tax=Chryseobacterium gleum ATCC 35910 TaxID=525257 RepID=A0ABN0ATF5_CHRGE|nr:hypothetical protein HMPREF0204_11819 [Chryseobacterium gleum ATCC 35910]
MFRIKKQNITYEKCQIIKQRCSKNNPWRTCFQTRMLRTRRKRKMYFMDRSRTKLSLVLSTDNNFEKPEVSGFSIYILTFWHSEQKPLTTDNQNFIIKMINKNISHYKEK